MLQGLYGAVSEIIQHLKEQFPPHTQHAKVHSLNHTVLLSVVQRGQSRKIRVLSFQTQKNLFQSLVRYFYFLENH